MRKHALMCEDAILKREPNKMVDHTTAIARLANRVLQVAKQEADNSEDPAFISDITRAADAVQAGILFDLNLLKNVILFVLTSCRDLLVAVAPMVQDAKSVALNIGDPAAASRWRESNKRVRFDIIFATFRYLLENFNIYLHSLFQLLNAVGNVRKTLTVPGDLNGLHINGTSSYDIAFIE